MKISFDTEEARKLQCRMWSAKLQRDSSDMTVNMILNCIFSDFEFNPNVDLYQVFKDTVVLAGYNGA